MTKTGIEEEGLAVCEMMEKVEGVEEGKMEKKAEEKVAEAELGVLPGMPGSCLSQEAEPQSPTMAEHKPRPDGSTAEGHIKVTDRIAGQKKVFRKRQKAKPKMQMAEAAGTEGGPRNTRAPFRLQNFMCFKISKCYTVLLLLVLLAFPVNSNETSKQRMCAVCLEKDCAIGVRKIYPAGSDIAVWPNANSPTGIQTCSMENLKPDAPCKMANGSLVQLADNPLQFEGIDTYGVRRAFHSQILPCADLNLPSKPSSGMCAVCLEKDCAIGVRLIYPADGDTPVWPKANSPTGIQSCSMENLKADAPCKMANGNLVQPADNPLYFEGIDTYGVWRVFHSQISPCAELNLPPSSTPSPGMCAVCLEKDCTTGVREISLAGSITTVWVKANSPTAIQNCSMENLKPDAPCKMANGSLAQLADNPLYFEGIDTYGVRRGFHSQILPCADLNLPSKPSPGQCAVCLEKDCANGVRVIYLEGSITPLWVKANSPTAIQTCSMENLKADAPCKMANGILAQLADNPLQFEGDDSFGVRRTFNSQILPCADLNLPSSSTPSPVIQAPIHNVPTPAAPNDSVADNKGIIISGVIGIVIVSGILIGVLIWKRKSRGQGQDGDHRHGNNGVPPHDAEHRDEISIQMQPLNAEVPNGNVNGVHREDGSVGTAGLLGHCDDTPV
ncbi:uncharacterized protein LOC135233423 isoform X1 [Anguilla rostrata]|uniref:uncharacterized protein LOC135233423 isoform X1 n=1 Tax=Anguilla rostrata TaxID=7938 RepID=UPI0030CBFFC0